MLYCYLLGFGPAPEYLVPMETAEPSSVVTHGDQHLDVSYLSVLQVLQCLRSLNLHRYVETFRTEQIDGELLMSIDWQMLIEDLGFTRFHALKLEKFAWDGWRPKVVPASPGSVDRQQQRRVGGVDDESTAQHGCGMFTWSKSHVTVRDVVDRRLCPTIVRISSGYRSESMPHKFNFHEGTVRGTRVKSLAYTSCQNRLRRQLYQNIGLMKAMCTYFKTIYDKTR